MNESQQIPFEALDNYSQPTITPERIVKLRESGALLLRNPDHQLTDENLFYLSSLESGRLLNTPININTLRKTIIEIPDAIVCLPDPTLKEKFANHSLTERVIVDPFDGIATTISIVRSKDFS